MLIIFTIILSLGTLSVFTLILFRLSCLFKKTCSRKKCPFRYKLSCCDFHMGISLLDADCRKCPYPFDSEEQKEWQHMTEKIESWINTLE